MRNLAIVFSLLLLTGCVTSNKPPVVGSARWHSDRIAEIQSVYDLGQIEEGEYLSLKTEADRVYVEYKASRRIQPRTSAIVGGGHHRSKHRGHGGHGGHGH